MAARRPPKIKIKPKVQKKTRSEQYIMNVKYLGLEPIFTDAPITRIKHLANLNWYAGMCSNAEAKEYLLEYLKNTNRLEEYKALKSLHERWMPTTACWIARMRSRGAKLPEDTLQFFEDAIKTAISEAQRRAQIEIEEEDGGTNPPAPKPSQKPSVQDRMKSQLSHWICELEEEFDKFWLTYKPTGFNMYTWLQANQIPPVQAKRILEYYEPRLLEIEAVVNKEADADIMEGYESYNPDNLFKLYGWLVMYVEDLEKFCQNEKKVRKPRTTKPISTEKKLKDFKWLKFDNTRKIQSIQPEKIFGASELWVFSTRYNQLTRFVVPNAGSFGVHRTAITGFDPALSKTKKIKAKEVDRVLNEVLNGGKVALRNLMDNFKGSDQKLQERMNENTLLLRAVPK